MPIESTHDPRDVLVRTKYFSLRPKPLERWLWQQGLPQAAERVFWLHWEEGMRSGSWCSEIPIKRVAAQCCVDVSTVTRAYQVLKSLELIRRQDPGRNPENPFQQATAVTEVRVPRALLIEIDRSPNRSSITVKPPESSSEGAALPESASAPTAAPEACHNVPEAITAGPQVGQAVDLYKPAVRCPTRQEAQAMWGRASAAERSRFLEAARVRGATMAFDPETTLTGADRAQMLAQLEHMARAPATQLVPVAPTALAATRDYARPRKLSALALARTRKRLLEAVPAHAAAEVLRQVVWAAEEGALRRFELPLAVNIALKKIREGAWTRPNRMPPNWWPSAAGTRAAAPGLCSVA